MSIDQFNLALESWSFQKKTGSGQIYERRNAKEIVIDVLNGPVDATTATNSNNAIAGSKQQVIAADKQFEYIKSNGNLVSTKKKHFFKSSTFWAFAVAAVISDAIPAATASANLDLSTLFLPLYIWGSSWMIVNCLPLNELIRTLNVVLLNKLTDRFIFPINTQNLY